MRLKILLPLLAVLLGVASVWGAWQGHYSHREAQSLRQVQARLEAAQSQIDQQVLDLKKRLGLLELWAPQNQELAQLALRAEQVGLKINEAWRIEQWPKRMRSSNLRELRRRANAEVELKITPELLAGTDDLWVVVDNLPPQAERLGEVLVQKPDAQGLKASVDVGLQQAGPGPWFGFSLPMDEGNPQWVLLTLDPSAWALELTQGISPDLGLEVSRQGDSLLKRAAPGGGTQHSVKIDASLVGLDWQFQVVAFAPPAALIGEQSEILLEVALLLLGLLAAFGLHRLAQNLETTQAERALWQARTLCFKQGLEEVRPEFGLQSALTAALEAVCRYANWPLAHLTLPDESRQQAQLNLWFEQVEGNFKSFIDAAESRNFQSGESLVDRVLAHEKIVWIENISEDVSFSRIKIQYDFGVKTAVGFPVMIGGDIVTVLEFYSDQELAWNQDQIDWTAGIIAQVGVLLDAYWAIQSRRRLEGRFEAVFSQVDEPLLLLNNDAQVESANRAFEVATGYKQVELIGRGLDLLLGDHEKLIQQTHQAIVEGNKLPFKRQLKTRRKDGQLIESTWFFSQSETDGRKTLIASFKSEAPAPAKPKATVAQTLSSGFEAQSRMAAENRLRGDYLATLGKEVQTPALAVSNLSRRLLHLPKAEDRQPLLQVLSQLSDQVSRKLTRAMELARLESGGLTLTEHPFDLRRLIGRTLDRYADQAQAKGLDIYSYINTEVPFFLVGDPQRIEEVLSILVENAVTYTAKGDVFLEVMALQQQNQSVELVFKITDTGPGISKERLSVLSHQITGKPKSAKEADLPALGLRLANGLAIRLGGGGLRFAAGSSKGLSVSVNVKLSVQPEQQGQGITLVRDLSGARILVLEAHEGLGQVLQKYLLAWGAQPLVLKGPAELLKLGNEKSLHGHVADLVVFDGLAAGSTAEEQLESIRKQAPDIPILWLGDRKSRKLPPVEARLQPLVYLSKPVKTLELYPLLMQQLGRWDKETAAQEPGPDLGILVVDDKKAEAQLVIQALEEAGFEVELAQSAQEAMEAYRSGNFGLVLADLSLPGTDGVELIRRIRNHDLGEQGFTRPIFAMVGHGEGERRLAAFEAGADNALPKPMDPRLLVSLVKDALYL
ncbi:MAG: response regulator [bacterium]|nr:response regulator [bacterium]